MVYNSVLLFLYTLKLSPYLTTVWLVPEAVLQKIVNHKVLKKVGGGTSKNQMTYSKTKKKTQKKNQVPYTASFSKHTVLRNIEILFDSSSCLSETRDWVCILL